MGRELSQHSNAIFLFTQNSAISRTSNLSFVAFDFSVLIHSTFLVGIPAVPTIPEIQSLIDAAWKKFVIL